MSLVNAAKVAAVLKCTTRRVRQLAEQNIIPREGHGQYDLAKVLLAMAQRGMGRLEQVAGEPAGLTAEREKLVRAQREREEFDLGKKKGEFVALSDYRKEVGELFMTLREHILSLPARVAPYLEGETREAIEVRLDEELRKMLTSLSTVNKNGNGHKRAKSAPGVHGEPAAAAGAAAEAHD